MIYGFKKGDKLQCIGYRGEQKLKAGTYTALKDEEEGIFPDSPFITVDTEYGPLCCHSSRFIKVSASMSKANVHAAYDAYSDTIRQQPSNYCLMVRINKRWVLDFDLAANAYVVECCVKQLWKLHARNGRGIVLADLINKCMRGEE